MVPFALALVAVFASKQKKYIVFFSSIGIVSLLFSLNTPFQNILTFLKIPVFSTSIPSRIIVLFSFSLAALSAYGYDTIGQIQKRTDKRYLLPFISLGIF